MEGRWRGRKEEGEEKKKGMSERREEKGRKEE